MTRYVGLPASKNERINSYNDNGDDYSIIYALTDDDDNGGDDYSNEGNEGYEDNDNLEDFFEEISNEQYTDILARKSKPSHVDTLPFGFITLDKCTTRQDLVIKPGITVELSPDAGLDHSRPDFLRIDSILRNLATDDVVVRGVRFRRATCLLGTLENKVNEVFMCQHINQQDDRSIRLQSLQDVSLDQVVCERVLIITNQTYPAWSYTQFRHPSCSYQQRIKEMAHLVCRWKYTPVCNARARTERSRNQEFILQMVSEQEADREFAISSQTLRTIARASLASNTTMDLTRADAIKDYTKAMDKIEKAKVKFEHDSKEGRRPKPMVRSVIDVDMISPDITVLDLSDEEQDGLSVTNIVTQITRPDPDRYRERSIRRVYEETFTATSSEHHALRHRVRKRKFTTAPSTQNYSGKSSYTFGDAFCCAGGVSSGARSAGLTVDWAFDIDKVPHSTYALNFPSANAHHMEAHRFITELPGEHSADCMHCSPPCGPWSKLHTVPGKNDDANQAALFAVYHLLQKVKPRVVTLEEVDGLPTGHPVFFYHLIQQFTSLGYSVRWKILNLAEYGVAQARNRVIIIASCPGEPLPPFPKPTHGPGLKPFTTIRDALRGIRRGMPNHDPDACPKRNVPSYSPDVQLKGCITTNGGESNFHPSGTRTFTHRELAALQSFPHDHVFLGGKTEVMRQIGNAVPPIFAKQLYETIIATLRATDAAEAAEAAKEDGKDDVGDKDVVRSGLSEEDAIMLD